ncbi:MAG TPA: hypothetical protein VK158_03190 [Acidobacteriota bacterium]|nr:hypothetical protein [Acidobacteriota bacterium]
MGLKITKKGVFFTASAIFILSLLLTYALSLSQVSDNRVSLSLSTRLSSINQFVDNVETDASIAAYTVGFRTLVAMIQTVEDKGVYLESVNANAKELFLNGTLNGTSSSILVNNTFTDWLQRIDQKAQTLGVDFSYEVQDVTISQTDPWNVDFEIDVNLLFVDATTKSQWNRSVQRISKVSIEGFSDPIYIIGTANQYVTSINQSPYLGNFVSGNNPANLNAHIQDGLYVQFDDAPNYLMRLQGNFSASNDGTGIESLVDKTALAFLMPIDATKSSVDYIYFSSQNPTSYGFTIMTPTFRLDNRTNGSGSVRHIALYQLTGFVG